ncbi:MAG: P1 family peptidase [Acidimicrobiales bacterium]
MTEVAGVRVGHWTDPAARTGCTVVLFPAGTVASGEVRGGAPATREFDLLAPERLVDRIDAVLLTGGSAFGLAAAAGVMEFCEERGIGFPTAAGPVPIVVGMGLFDLLVGDPAVRPGSDEGYAACEAAHTGPVTLGAVGAGAGCTAGKWQGFEHAHPAGLGGAARHHGDGLIVAALIAVNAFGDARELSDELRLPRLAGPENAFGNTSVGVVATNARLDKSGCLLVAHSGHDGLARALAPSHTRFDGDALVVAATGAVDAQLDVVRELAAVAVEGATRWGATGGTAE